MTPTRTGVRTSTARPPSATTARALRELLHNFLRLLLVAIVATAHARAEIPLANPNLNLLTNGTVFTIATQPDGGLVFGGSFSAVDGEPRNNIARLLADGNLDTMWNPSADGAIFALTVDADGGVYAGGEFHTIGGHSRNGVARLVGAYGRSDELWDAAAPADTITYALALSADGDVFAACSSYVTKLSRNDGKPVTAFATAYASAYVYALAVAADGSLYAGGTFDGLGGYARDRIARLSPTTGAVDPDWVAELPGTPADGVVALVADGHGALFAGGPFGVQKLSAQSAGAVTGWHVTTADVHALAVGYDGALYAGGYFVAIGGAPRRNIAQLSAETGDANPNWNATASWYVYAVARRPDGGVLAGGNFDSIAGNERLALAALSADGTVMAPLADVESPGSVHALVAQPDGGTIVGGYFHRVGSVQRRHILRLGPDGELDLAWSPGLDFDPRTLAIDADATVYAAGAGFYGSDGSQIWSMAKMSGSGTGDVDADWNPTPDGAVNALLVDVSGSVFAGGEFDSIGGAPRARLAKLSATTGLADPNWNADVDCCSVEALAPGSDGTFYVGGIFTHAGGAERRSLARLSIDSALADPLWDPSPDGYIYALANTTDGAIYAGGQFFMIGGEYRHLLAKLSTSGNGAADRQWQANLGGLGFDPPDLHQYVGPLSVDARGTLYATGWFYLGYDWNWSLLARFSGISGDADRNWKPLPWGTDPYVVSAGANGAVTLGGNFVEASGETRVGLVAYAQTLPDAIFTDGVDGPPK